MTYRWFIVCLAPLKPHLATAVDGCFSHYMQTCCLGSLLTFARLSELWANFQYIWLDRCCSPVVVWICLLRLVRCCHFPIFLPLCHRRSQKEVLDSCIQICWLVESCGCGRLSSFGKWFRTFSVPPAPCLKRRCVWNAVTTGCCSEPPGGLLRGWVGGNTLTRGCSWVSLDYHGHSVTVTTSHDISYLNPDLGWLTSPVSSYSLARPACTTLDRFSCGEQIHLRLARRHNAGIMGNHLRQIERLFRGW